MSHNPNLKPSFEDEFPQPANEVASEAQQRRYERGEITAAEAGFVTAAAIHSQNLETEEPEARPTTAVPTKNADAGGFKEVPYSKLTPSERRVADNDPPAHIRHR
jgi:hypothetical protein